MMFALTSPPGAHPIAGNQVSAILYPLPTSPYQHSRCLSDVPYCAKKAHDKRARAGMHIQAIALCSQWEGVPSTSVHMPTSAIRQPSSLRRTGLHHPRLDIRAGPVDIKEELGAKRGVADLAEREVETQSAGRGSKVRTGGIRTFRGSSKRDVIFSDLPSITASHICCPWNGRTVIEPRVLQSWTASTPVEYRKSVAEICPVDSVSVVPYAVVPIDPLLPVLAWVPRPRTLTKGEETAALAGPTAAESKWPGVSRMHARTCLVTLVTIIATFQLHFCTLVES